MLKECSNEISPILALILNVSSRQCIRKLATSKCFSVFKKGEKYDAANYRLVFVTCICCKILDHILVSSINRHLHDILAFCQHGFQNERPCETQLVQFVHDITSNLDGAVNRGHQKTDLIIMKLAKAIDKVPHGRLFQNLEYYGIGWSIHRWINSWLSGRTH